MKRKEFGILMPVFSLPSCGGIGSMGAEAYSFVDWLVEANQHYWQVLPLTVTDGSSPYMGFSSFAGNHLLISLEKLKSEGLITQVPVWRGKTGRIDYSWVEEQHLSALREAYENHKHQEEVQDFISKNEWVKDYAMFMSLKDYFHKPLQEWDEDIRTRQKKAINYYKGLLSDAINFHIFIQYKFFQQWFELKEYANYKGVEIIGDVPIYVSSNSADVWGEPGLFKVNEKTLCAIKVAGCPPDAYAEDGQYWGNPVYDWTYHEKTDYKWWISRIRHLLKIVDVLRIDHFRAFDRYWEISAKEKTAKNGMWVDGPKMRLFDMLNKKIPNARIIAEDLGTIDDGVRNLLKETGYPGMKVMIFGLTEENEHTPQNWPENAVGYTSTHDSEPIRAAIENLSREQYSRVAKMLKIFTPTEIGMCAIRAAYDTRARIVIIPIVDVLSLGFEGRINTPGTVGPENWSWRAETESITETIASKLASLVQYYE